MNEFINFKARVKDFAILLTHVVYKGSYAIDINSYGITPYFDDPENATIYRDNIMEIAHELFNFDTEEAQKGARLQDALADELTLRGK